MDILLKIHKDCFTLFLQLLSLVCMNSESVCQMLIFLLSSRQILLAASKCGKEKILEKDFQISLATF